MGEAETDGSGVESTTSVVEQLGKIFIELKSHEDVAENSVQWEELEEYYHNLQTLLRKKFKELEKKNKSFEEKEAETRILVQEREADVAAKERAMMDRVQEIKEAALASIQEAREKCKLVSPNAGIADGDAQNKVTSSLNGDPDRSGEFAMDVEFQPRLELTRYCEQMDAKGLLKFITANQKYTSSLRQELPIALKSATEPARLVLDSLEGFYPPDFNTNQGDKTDTVLQSMYKSYVILMESVAPLLLGGETDVGYTLNPETKQHAKVIADVWKSRLDEAGTDVANGNSLEAKAFLQLLATFRIASEFDEGELCKLVLASARGRQTPELCRSLGLTDKVPGIIETLINMGRQIDAAHFVHAFKLNEKFPPVPLLKTYLKDLRRNSQRKDTNSGAGGVQIDANTQELTALKLVIRCVKDYKLQAEYPLEPLQRRFSQLEKSKTYRKRTGEMVKQQYPKKARANGGYYGHQMPVAVAVVDRQLPPVYGEVRGYTGLLEAYPSAGATAYDYQGPCQGYAQQDIAQRFNVYPQDESHPSLSCAGVPSNYGATASASNYVAASYTSAGAPSNYGAYTGGALPSSYI